MWSPVFSPDGNKVAYAAEENDESFIVVGDEKMVVFDDVSTPIFSPDGKKLAFGARRGREIWWKVIKV